MIKNSSFTHIVLDWYEKNKRELPWRETLDPYAIWLSEIILQQTRIDQGRAYYLKFINRFPFIHDFAAASEDEILKMWQGLGYYSRARNMHHTAKMIVEKHGGAFPADYAGLLRLKGVGEYTAAAIASIAFGLPHATVDGNVYRLLSRVFEIHTPTDTGKGKKEFTHLANKLIDPSQPGNFNQAVMEFGAIQCKPKNPDCESCPLNQHCAARKNGTIDLLPIKKGKTKIRKRYFNYLVIEHEQYTYLNKRTENDIWKNLYEFPMAETNEKSELAVILKNYEMLFSPETEIQIKKESHWQKQVLTHQHIFYRFIYLKIDGKMKIPSPLIRVNKKDIFNFAVPKPIEKELEQHNWI